MTTLAAWGQDPIEGYLDSAQRKANDVVYNAGAQGRGVAMEAGQAALNAIASFRAAYADSLKKTENSLSGQQAQLFQTIKSSMGLLDEWSQGTGNNIQSVADTLANAVLNIPLSHDVPRVTKAGPLYSVDLNGAADELVIHGVGLSNGSPFLDIGGRKVGPNTKTDAEIRFSMPPHTPVVDKPLLYPVVLHLYERHPKYLGLSSDYVERTYPIRLAIYPRQIGKVSVIARRRVSQVERQPRSSPNYRCESDHGDGSKSTAANVVATPGWNIDVSTIQWNKNYENHGAFTMGTTSPAGFTATLSCYGWGKVEKFGVTVDAGQQGVEQGTFSYQETREGTALQNTEAKTLLLKWGDSLTVSDMPADTETVLIELIPFTGQTLDLEGSGNNRFMVLQFNASSKVATIAARGIEEALRQGG